MSSNNSSRKVVTVDEQAFEKAGEQAVDEDGFLVVDETPEFEAAVEQETQAKVDANHPEGIVQEFSHLTLEREEEIRGREAELERISAQAELGRSKGRAKRTRRVVTERCSRVARSANSRHVQTDPREQLTQSELAAVNREAMRISKEVPWTRCRAAVGRALAHRLLDGQDLTTAVLETLEQQRRSPFTLTPIEDVPSYPDYEVSVEGTVIDLWDARDPDVQQVGLLRDDTDKIKFITFKSTQPPGVTEGECVRLRCAEKSWYQGRCSLKVTGDTHVVFPDRDRWWDTSETRRGTPLSMERSRK